MENRLVKWHTFTSILTMVYYIFYVLNRRLFESYSIYILLSGLIILNIFIVVWLIYQIVKQKEKSSKWPIFRLIINLALLVLIWI